MGIPAAWGFAKYRFPLKKAVFTLYILLMMMPFQVTMLSNYLVLDRLHLLNTHAGIILPGGFFHISGIHHVPFFLRRAGFHPGSRAD